MTSTQVRHNTVADLHNLCVYGWIVNRKSGKTDTDAAQRKAEVTAQTFFNVESV